MLIYRSFRWITILSFFSTKRTIPRTICHPNWQWNLANFKASFTLRTGQIFTSITFLSFFSREMAQRNTRETFLSDFPPWIVNEIVNKLGQSDIKLHNGFWNEISYILRCTYMNIYRGKNAITFGLYHNFSSLPRRQCN